ncbi:MAG TPA: lipoprotein-releasing ABC transporter permease subunit [Rhizomicrobium sp.]|nr:lipoprotein-releasing ABC transporter permease subunit [Rhizomicrobium sp.]
MAESNPSRPFAPFEWMIAKRYLRAKRQESFISVISIFSLVGIALGVATLIIVMSVMGGFRNQFIQSLVGFNGHISVQAVGQPIVTYDAIAARLRAVPGVTRAAPIIDGQVMATARGANSGVVVRGMRAGDLNTLKSVATGLSPNALRNYGSEGVIIGSGLADKLGLRPGDSIKLISPRGDETPFGPTLRQKDYVVAGTFKVGNSLYDSGFIFMALDEAQAYFRYEGGVTAIEVMVTNPEENMAFMPQLSKAAGPGTSLRPWQTFNSGFLEVVEIEKNVMFLILSLIILVAALNIISGLVMLVKDKSADIAILRTMGASRGAVMRVFLIAGMSIGVTGTLVGTGLGVLFCLNIENIRQGLQTVTGIKLFDETFYFLSRMPADLDAMQVAGVVAMALTLTFLATLYPSWRAARLDPVEALRYE